MFPFQLFFLFLFHQNDEVTSVTHIEDLERHLLEEDLRDNNDDGDSAN